jgi:hypothetical protein
VFSVEGEASLTEADPYQYSEITLYLFLESTLSVCTCVFNLSSSFVISFVYVCVNLPVSHPPPGLRPSSLPPLSPHCIQPFGSPSTRLPRSEDLQPITFPPKTPTRSFRPRVPSSLSKSFSPAPSPEHDSFQGPGISPSLSLHSAPTAHDRHSPCFPQEQKRKHNADRERELEPIFEPRREQPRLIAIAVEVPARPAARLNKRSAKGKRQSASRNSLVLPGPKRSRTVSRQK